MPPREGRVMILSAITGIGSPNFVSNVSPASFNRKVGSVDADVAKQPALISDYDSFSLSKDFMNLMGDSSDKVSLLGSGDTANKLTDNQLRQRGQLSQLMGSGESQNPEATSGDDVEGSDEFGNALEDAIAKINGTEENGDEAQAEGARSSEGSDNQELTEEEQQQVEELKARDQEVRVHEQAHLAAAGGYATSGASYTYQRGPDGKNYAIGGEVSIDTSPGSTPEETIQKMNVVQKAALAPAQPSGQDRSVAAAAAQAKMQAQQELAEQRAEGSDEDQEAAAPEAAASESGESAEAGQSSEAAQAGENSENSESQGGLASMEELSAMQNESANSASQTSGGDNEAAAATNAANPVAIASLSYRQAAAISAYGIAG